MKPNRSARMLLRYYRDWLEQVKKSGENVEMLLAATDCLCRSIDKHPDKVSAEVLAAIGQDLVELTDDGKPTIPTGWVPRVMLTLKDDDDVSWANFQGGA